MNELERHDDDQVNVVGDVKQAKALDFNCETKVDDCYLLQISFFIAMRKIANSFEMEQFKCIKKFE